MEIGHGDEATMRDSAAGDEVLEVNLLAVADFQAEKSQPAEEQQSPVSPTEPRNPLPPDPGFNFKLRPLQWPFLVSLIVIILSLIALTEYACRVLPANEDSSASAVPPSPSSPPAAVTTAVAVPPRAVPSPTLPLRKRQQRDPITARNDTTIVSRTPITRTLPSRTLLSSSETDTIPSRTRQALTPSGTLDAASESRSFTISHKVPWPGGVRSGSKTDPGAFATDGDVTLTSTILRDAGPTTTPSRQLFASKVTINRGGQNRGGPTQQQEQQPTVLIGGGSTLSPGSAQTQPASASESGGSNEGEAAALTTLDGVVTTITGGFFSSLTSTVTVDGVVTTETGRIFQPSTSTATLDDIVVLDIDYVTPRVKTLRAASGAPTAAPTLTPPPIYTPTGITLYGPNGVPIATVSTSAAIPPLTTILADDGGAPATTLTEYPAYHNASIPAPATSAPQPGASAPQPQTVQIVYHITKLEYFVGFFLPPLLSVSLTILIRILDLSAKQLQPFHELTYARGAAAAESLCLQTSGPHGIAASARTQIGGRVLVFLTTLLLLCSAFLVPLSSEAVALKLHGSCATNSFSGCAMTLAVFPEPATATMALRGLMALLTLIIALFLTSWRSGVAANPWSIAGIASLSTNPAVRSLLLSAGGSGAGGGARLSNRQLASAFDDGAWGQQGIAAGSRRFKLAYFRGVDGLPEYGITIVGDNEDDASSACPRAGVSPSPLPLGRLDSLASAASSLSTGCEVDHKQCPPARRAVLTKNHARPPPFAMLSYTGRLVFVTLLLGLLVVILYYNQTYASTSFEAFLDSQGFGVRFLFTAIGVIVTFFWSSFFTSMSPHHLLFQPSFASPINLSLLLQITDVGVCRCSHPQPLLPPLLGPAARRAVHPPDSPDARPAGHRQRPPTTPLLPRRGRRRGHHGRVHANPAQ